jgi:hypothetical protein
MAAIGGHVVGANHQVVKDALVYVVVHHAGETSLPLATLTISNGGWLVALANAVTPAHQTFLLQTGETVSIRVLTGRMSAGQTVTLRSLDQPTLLSRPLILH